MGSAAGALKTAAVRVGVSVDEYERRVSAGERWCHGCQAWHLAAEFGSARNQPDGLQRLCRKAAAVYREGRPRGPRDQQRERARWVIADRIKRGVIPPANELPCTDCGHVYVEGERRHEYDHHLGYEPSHARDVEPVCTTCHAQREIDRRFPE